MSVETVSALRMTRMIHADQQAVWDAWTQPEHMKVWSCPQPGGVTDLSVDLRVGGAFTIRMIVEGSEYNAFGTYREVEAPRRLVYTWDWKEEDHRVGETVVTVEFNSVDVGTEVVLVHDGFPADEEREGHEQGWGGCLNLFEGLFA